MDKLLAALREFDALRDGDGGDIVARASLPSVAPTYAASSVDESLPRAIAQGLRARGIERLYRHQADAIEAALADHNVVLQAPTASGKTLAFQVPMLQSLATERGTHALMIYPNKALALDQREQLEALASQMPGRKIESWWYDGDTPREERAALRQSPPQILITNPEMINATFLGHADQWQQFLRGLRWVIVDEMHEYRGYFGSNVAILLRRLSHHLSMLGVHPQFFLSSATCANAQEHAENLTGLSFEEVNAADMLRPHREFYFVQPNIPDFQYWDILQLRTVKAGLACLHMGKSVLAFCPTRKFAETCHRIAIREIEQLREQHEVELDHTAVRVFRSGLSTDERHEIQGGLKDGSVRLVFTTNALELGIDIGGLDGVILAGFPDSMMSAWQRIGRAGRNWNTDAFVLYYARNNPLDRFYASNLDTFLNKPLDDLVANAANEDLIDNHLPALLFETPGFDGEKDLLGEALYEAARAKRASGAQPVQSGRYRPHHLIPIRGAGGGSFTLQDGSNKIGTLSSQQQFREAYQRAIYMHGGRTYRVQEVSLTGNGGEILLTAEDPQYQTNASLWTTVHERDIEAGWRWATDDSTVSAYYGQVLITEAMSAVEEKNTLTGEIIDRWVPAHSQARFDNAHAYWIALEPRSDDAATGITALQHLFRIGALFSIPLDAHDIFPHADVREQKAYLVESYPGGIGIARKALERWRSILETGIEVAESCSCHRGCPNCIMPPRERGELDKIAGIRLARMLLQASEEPPQMKFVKGLWEAV